MAEPASGRHPSLRKHGAIAALVAGLALLSAAGIGWWRQWRQPLLVSLGMPRPLTRGAAINPSDRYAADLFLSERPTSRIRIVDTLGTQDPSEISASIAALKQRGVRFFITAYPSSHAVQALHHFRSGDAININVSATSNALSGHDDFFFRLVPDLVQEQRAIARELARRPGGRLLVLQDTGNRPYTDPAYGVFRRELQRSRRWQIVHRSLLVNRFTPAAGRSLMQGDFQALYVLAGSFQPAIGHLSQLFHQLHPGAAILLTPWARSPQIVENAGAANAVTTILSPYPARAASPALDRYLRRFEARFHHTPYALGIGTRQALELFDQAFASGATSPAEVKRYLLSRPSHPTSFGPIHFDASGDVQAVFQAIAPTADQPR